MYETYRMLGKVHEADLEREAQKRRRAVELRGRRSVDARPGTTGRRKRLSPVLARVAALVGLA
jgi:hypothetical protein